jgi:hypothetical protein
VTYTGVITAAAPGHAGTVTPGVALRLWVPGHPRSQGSLKPNMAHAGRYTADWRAEVVTAAEDAWHPGRRTWMGLDHDRPPITDAVAVTCHFTFRKPPRTEHEAFPVGGKHPDLDKLIRCVWDALVIAGVLADDRLVVESGESKRWAVPMISEPGALIEVRGADR